MHIHLLKAYYQHQLRSSKDTNGGYGTVNDFGHGFVATFLKYLKRETMNFPELLPAYVQAILKRRGHHVTYSENALPASADLVLIQASIVDFQAELDWAARARLQIPTARIGFMGGMAAGNPHLYAEHGDFVIAGEVESALIDGDVEGFAGLVSSQPMKDLDELPFPDWSHLSGQPPTYRLIPARKGGFFPVLSSRGCPMSCAYYCTYPLVQGAKFRARSPQNVVEELEYLQRQYGMTTVLFRDPIFSLNMGRVAEICELILQRGLKFTWICETHPRFLDAALVQLMARAGCVAVKLGIESGSLEVMQKSRRAAPDLLYQEQIIACLEQNHIDVLGFYILGYFDDDRESILQTIAYAEKLNTYGAQFTIATPYPGTPWYNDLQRDNERFQLDPHMDHYNQYRLVYSHPHLSYAELEALKSLAYRRYYLRWAFLWKHIFKRTWSWFKVTNS